MDEGIGGNNCSSITNDQSCHSIDLPNRAFRGPRSRWTWLGSIVKKVAVSSLKAQGTTANRDADDSEALTEDCEHIGLTVDMYSRQLEARVPIVISLIQIIDSQRSFTETANVMRLTYLALVFVPSTYVASLFSVNDALAPNGRIFWLYVVTAIPLNMVVSLLTRPRGRTHKLLHAWV